MTTGPTPPGPAAPIRLRAIVSGRVQGVGFRVSTAREARRLGLTGFVSNRRDGTVEVEAQGAPESVAALVDWLSAGPPGARVIDVDTVGIPVGGEGDFAIR